MYPLKCVEICCSQSYPISHSNILTVLKTALHELWVMVPWMWRNIYHAKIIIGAFGSCMKQFIRNESFTYLSYVTLPIRPRTFPIVYSYVLFFIFYLYLGVLCSHNLSIAFSKMEIGRYRIYCTWCFSETTSIIYQKIGKSNYLNVFGN
jgi:hypothetical protein